MSSMETWRYLHILMFVFWVGTDMGVMLAARKSTDSRLTLETRLTLVRMALLIELLPRAMWALALPTGVALSRQANLLEISDAGYASVWLFTFAWLSISLGGAHFADRPFGRNLAAANRGIIGVLGGALLLIGAWSYFGAGPFESRWLASKVAIYGLINLTVLGIEAAFVPVGVAFGRLVVEGSTAPVETAISGGMRTTMFWVFTSYTLILIVGCIGIVRPEVIGPAFLAVLAAVALAANMCFAAMGRMLRTA